MSSPTGTFYTFDGSVWCIAPRLAIVELGYPKDAFEVKTTNLLEGENFNPEFLKIAPNGTLPTLVTKDSKVLDDTAKVVKYLIDNSPTPVKSTSNGSDIIEAVHGENIDPNDLLLKYSRNDDERKAKAKDVPGQFWGGRQKTLTKYAESPPAELKDFYAGKVKYNDKYNNIYFGSPDDTELKKYYSEANTLWTNVGDFLNKQLPSYLKQRNGTPYFGGDKPGEVDFHVIAWLARTVTAAGDVDKLAESIGGKLDSDVKQYFEQWAARDSYKKLQIA